MHVIFFLALLWMMCLAILLFLYRRPLRILWAEPVFRYPILILESDDWGTGPREQEDSLRELMGVLTQYRDQSGRHPVVTLALVLALPAQQQVGEEGSYRRRTLIDPEFAAVLSVLKEGAATSLFALQLHGLEHYWPDALLSAAKADSAVRAWLQSPAQTEMLPSHLQSRWTDASVLPSRQLPENQIKSAVVEETALFMRALGVPPSIVVPPTFIWNDLVEAAWATAGVRFVVTPGRRYVLCDEAGQPGGAGGLIVNGQYGQGGVVYLVRDDYFEPLLGHTAARALAAVRQKYLLGRPCLLECHRFNFLGERSARALEEVAAMYKQTLAELPNLRFLSTSELGIAIVKRDPAWIEPRLAKRLNVWLRRIAQLTRFWKLARGIGIAGLLLFMGYVGMAVIK